MQKKYSAPLKAKCAVLAATVSIFCGSVGVADARVIQVMPGTTASYTFFPRELVTNKNQLPVVVEGSVCLNPAEEGKGGITAAGVMLICKSGTWKRPSSTPVKVEGAACANPGEEGYLAVTSAGVGLVCKAGLWNRPVSGLAGTRTTYGPYYTGASSCNTVNIGAHSFCSVSYSYANEKGFSTQRVFKSGANFFIEVCSNSDSSGYAFGSADCLD